MFSRLLAVFARDLPHFGELAYCLMKDPRISLPKKMALAATLAAIYSPFVDLPASLPLVGELDVLALTLLALKLFVSSCPRDVVAFHEQQLASGQSSLHMDLDHGGQMARQFWESWRHHGMAWPGHGSGSRGKNAGAGDGAQGEGGQQSAPGVDNSSSKDKAAG